MEKILEKRNMNRTIDVWELLGGTLLYFILNIKIYTTLKSLNISKYALLLPFIGYYLLFFFIIVFKKKQVPLTITISVILTGVGLWGVTKNELLYSFYLLHEVKIMFFIMIISLVVIAKDINKKNINKEDDQVLQDDLFNLFYINTPKVHEIAMLIDNKVMKNFEEARETEELDRAHYSLGVVDKGKYKGEISNSKEFKSKQSIQQSFDVKTTKSTLLRSIYKKIKSNEVTNKEQGKLLLFESVKLEQKNTDDTVMLLKIMKDMNMVQPVEDNIEINISKAMNEMLEDFTIDYIFNYKEEVFLVRIPYNSKEHFENSYSHNDLQMGELSIVGIYRGDVDFTNITSISDKFMEIVSNSLPVKTTSNTINMEEGLSSSINFIEKDEKEFNINSNKLDGKYHLIDLIAIIQEIKV